MTGYFPARLLLSRALREIGCWTTLAHTSTKLSLGEYPGVHLVSKEKVLWKSLF